MQHSLNWILDTLFASDGMEFDAEAYRAMCGPCVYVIEAADGEVLYIGQSVNGISRVTALDHHANARWAHLFHRLRLYPCKDKAAAVRAEEILIYLLCPTTNKTNRVDRLKRIRPTL
jgi:hypothetical protein